MNTTRLLFWLMVIGPLHMGEQLIFGVEELDLFKGPVADYYSALDGVGPDRATVILITVVVTLFTWLSYAMLSGGWQRLVALGLFGLLGANEGHHVIQAILGGGYDSGLITSVPYSVTGILMLVEVARESRTRWNSSMPAVSPA